MLISSGRHRPREDSSVLSNILGRLQHLEEQNSANDLSGVPETTAPIPPGASDTPSSHVDSDQSFNSVPPVVSRIDPFRLFEDAMQQMQRFKSQYYSKQVIMGKIDIPTELAKQWIYSKYSFHSICVLTKSVNRLFCSEF